MKTNNLIIILGPTAVGKTKISTLLSEKIKCPILSCDSRQFYKELNIGTDKPEKKIRKKIKHYFIDSLSLDQEYNVGQFEKDSINLLNILFKKNKNIIMVGGSGLYINSICKGIDEMPKVNVKIREKLNKIYKKQGIEYFQNILKQKDPDFYKTVDKKNHQRLIRATEILIQTKKTFSSFRKGKKKKRDFNIILIGIKDKKENLYIKINKRVEKMIKKGLIEEAKKLYIYKNKNSMQTIGYKEAFMYLDGEIDKKKCIEMIKRNTRRYSKRQMTWFNKMKSVKWFLNTEEKSIHDYLINQIN